MSYKSFIYLCVCVCILVRMLAPMVGVEEEGVVEEGEGGGIAGGNGPSGRDGKEGGDWRRHRREGEEEVEVRVGEFVEESRGGERGDARGRKLYGIVGGKGGDGRAHGGRGGEGGRCRSESGRTRWWDYRRGRWRRKRRQCWGQHTKQQRRRGHCQW